MNNTLHSKIVVTGGSGFIGSRLVEKLYELGFENIVVVDVVPPKTNFCSYVEADFDNTETMTNVVKGAKCVFHLAAMIGVDNCRLHPNEVNEVNNVNTKKFIDLCIKQKVNRFIFSSSSEVYGNSTIIPYKEDASLQPISMYAKCKLEIEEYLAKIQADSKMTVGIIRFFNVYGPHQKKAFVIPIFAEKIMKDQSLVIFGDGSQTRCFTFIDDAIEGIIKVFQHTQSNYEIFNIGNSKEYSINELVNVFKTIVPNSKSEIVYENYGNNAREAELEILRRVPSIDKALRLLNFRATVSLEEGLRLVVNELRQEYGST